MRKETETPESALIRLLLREMRMPTHKHEIKERHWVEKHFGIPDRPEDILWRFAWLVIVPAIATLVYMPLSNWLWQTGQGLLMWVGTLAIAFCLLFYAFVVSRAADAKLKPLVNLQLFIPWFTVLVVMIWHGVSPYVQQ